MQYPHTKEGHKDLPRKRVARACDRCRLKKGKCDGKEQCAKCLSADIMCIYTDRKPPQHKQISPGVAEALQSENLTIKKACVVLFKELLMARQSSLPVLEGVDWNSEKVANGKSGRALNYIISQEARVDNRISSDDITNYESDTASHHDDSPASQHPSPRSTTSTSTTSTTTGEGPSSFWLQPAQGYPEQTAPVSNQTGKRRYYTPVGTSKYLYPTGQQETSNRRHIRTSSHPNPNTFYMYNGPLEQQANFGVPTSHTSTPISSVESLHGPWVQQQPSQEEETFFQNVDPYTGAARDDAMTATTEDWNMNPQFYDYVPTSSAGMEDTRYEQTNGYYTP